MKAIVISQPKAGTYLLGDLLRQFGMIHTFMHTGSDSVFKYPVDNPEESRKGHTKYLVKQPLTQTIAEVPENGILLSHLEYSKTNAEVLRDFHKIFLTRDKQGVSQSLKRWNNFSGRRNYSIGEVNRITRKVSPWRNEAGVFTMQFDDMINVNVVHDSRLAMTKALASDTITKSPQRLNQE
jgi:hypothetical protein